MESSKILTGCGIGCGIVVFLCVLIGFVGFLFIKDTAQNFERMEASIEQLEKEYGEISDYTPEADGRISSERIETFLQVRAEMAGMRQELENGLIAFSQDIRELESSGPSFFRVIRLIRKGVSGIPQLVGFYAERSENLMENNMSGGEYYYIYVTVYHLWLGNPLEDGPDFRLIGNQEGKSGRGEEVFRERRQRYLSQVRRNFRVLFRNQLEAIQAQADASKHQEWTSILRRELEAIEQNYDRLPWQDGLPDVIRSSLEPYRPELESGYSPLMNPLELGLDDE